MLGVLRTKLRKMREHLEDLGQKDEDCELETNKKKPI